MDNFDTPEQLAASMQQKQQQMQQMQPMQQTIAAQQLAAQHQPLPPIGATDATTETETSEENQQDVSYVNGQGWQFKSYHPNSNNQNQNGKMFILSQAQNQFQNMQNNPQATLATASEKGNQKEGEQPPLENVLDDKQDAEQPTVIEPIAPTTQEHHVPSRVYTPKVPYPVPAKKSRKDCEEMKCKKMLEELNVKLSLMDAI
ncbi:hypothetical protein DY000_02047482 [Brassica cretica]|uniref:Uncharacterized protein n=1 Tax=Brassica cretica TaxID=69181 RepID=A0ABQ7F4Q3_BRACR|nr:hypothetical protein DY000_02047482 [Brassica cretica]